ncbi:MAG TPA: hypothetical protein VKZ63_04640 [Kofleriaceae bacterium]|nr:hypothetical protein [Kofleriaceae bacterium]
MSDSDRDDDRDEQGAPASTLRGSLLMAVVMGGLLALIILINLC